ncbi:peroxisomal membrane protein 11C-like [Cydia fagiglandana]|uniref:peroxisomal membrane protein 11C-like n=1 Tax=Cydia fagiglandana TaxID=1458189 RepID=UPI002FEE46BC
MCEVVDEFCELLQVHANRDKVVSLASYSLKLWGARTQSKPLLGASARLAGARATLRLFDDAAALRAAINYGWGKQEGAFWGSLGVASSAVTLAFLQAEKLVWLLDTGLLTLSQDLDYRLRTAHKTLWFLISTVGFIRSIKALHIAANELKSPHPRKCAPARLTQASLLSTKLFLDVIHFGSWLPIGWLWGGRLSLEHGSGIATASAVLGLVAHYHGKRLASR